MKKIVNVINRKADEMSQETFNVLLSILITIFIIIPLFVVGFERWFSIYK
jgi:hypothetical protein